MLAAFEVLILKLAALDVWDWLLWRPFLKLAAFDVWGCLHWRLYFGDWLHLMFEAVCIGDYILETDCIWCLRLAARTALCHRQEVWECVHSLEAQQKDEESSLETHLQNSRHRRTSMQQLLSSFFFGASFFFSLGLRPWHKHRQPDSIMVAPNHREIQLENEKTIKLVSNRTKDF